ncbi:MAG: M15 family metallopeptidase [Desulfovibrionaceae bacterium]
MVRHISLVTFLLLAAALPARADTAKQALEAHGFIEVVDVIPDIVLDIRYATANNFTGDVVYPCGRCYLRRDVAQRLARAQEVLRPLGLGLKIFDGYRPFRVQERFWELVPDERYVARPKRENGVIIVGSRHNLGAAVDVSLVDAAGNDLEMPTDYDDFSDKARPDWDGTSDTAKKNRALLLKVMQDAGFTVYPTEWWHYDAPGWEGYEMLDLPFCD